MPPTKYIKGPHKKVGGAKGKKAKGKKPFNPGAYASARKNHFGIK